jgi:hypothetical protein
MTRIASGMSASLIGTQWPPQEQFPW